MKDFFKRVHEMVARIPEGKVATYGLIATLLGQPGNGRVVGWAMRKAPDNLKLPCHRVYVLLKCPAAWIIELEDGSRIRGKY